MTVETKRPSTFFIFKRDELQNQIDLVLSKTLQPTLFSEIYPK